MELSNFHEHNDCWLDALIKKYSETEDFNAKNVVLNLLAESGYYFEGSKKQIDVLLAAGHSGAYQIIAKMKDKEYIPLLEQRLEKADGKDASAIKACLMKLGVDEY